jgi:hypothetical protein
MNHRYLFCGFALASDRGIPELDETGSVTPDPDRLVNIHLGEAGRQFPEPSEWFMRQDLPNGVPWSARARRISASLL